jgi:hypothetical protein
MSNLIAVWSIFFDIAIILIYFFNLKHFKDSMLLHVLRKKTSIWVQSIQLVCISREQGQSPASDMTQTEFLMVAGPHYIALAWTAQRTPLPAALLLLWPIPSNGSICYNVYLWYSVNQMQGQLYLYLYQHPLLKQKEVTTYGNRL